MTRKELAKLDPWTSIYRAKSTMETAKKWPVGSKQARLLWDHAYELVAEGCKILEAKEEVMRRLLLRLAKSKSRKERV